MDGTDVYDQVDGVRLHLKTWAAGRRDAPALWLLHIATADGVVQALSETGLLDWAAWLERLHTPTLVLAADPAVGGMLRAAGRAAIPCIAFPGCGHELALATPQAVVTAVSAFLA